MPTEGPASMQPAYGQVHCIPRAPHLAQPEASVHSGGVPSRSLQLQASTRPSQSRLKRKKPSPSPSPTRCLPSTTQSKLAPALGASEDGESSPELEVRPRKQAFQTRPRHVPALQAQPLVFGRWPPRMCADDADANPGEPAAPVAAQPSAPFAASAVAPLSEHASSGGTPLHSPTPQHALTGHCPPPATAHANEAQAGLLASNRTAPGGAVDAHAKQCPSAHAAAGDAVSERPWSSRTGVEPDAACAPVSDAMSVQHPGLPDFGAATPAGAGGTGSMRLACAPAAREPGAESQSAGALPAGCAQLNPNPAASAAQSRRDPLAGCTPCPAYHPQHLTRQDLCVPMHGGCEVMNMSLNPSSTGVARAESAGQHDSDGYNLLCSTPASAIAPGAISPHTLLRQAMASHGPQSSLQENLGTAAAPGHAAIAAQSGSSTKPKPAPTPQCQLTLPTPCSRATSADLQRGASDSAATNKVTGAYRHAAVASIVQAFDRPQKSSSPSPTEAKCRAAATPQSLAVPWAAVQSTEFAHTSAASATSARTSVPIMGDQQGAFTPAATQPPRTQPRPVFWPRSGLHTCAPVDSHSLTQTPQPPFRLFTDTYGPSSVPSSQQPESAHFSWASPSDAKETGPAQSCIAAPPKFSTAVPAPAQACRTATVLALPSSHCSQMHPGASCPVSANAASQPNLAPSLPRHARTVGSTTLTGPPPAMRPPPHSAAAHSAHGAADKPTPASPQAQQVHQAARCSSFSAGAAPSEDDLMLVLLRDTAAEAHLHSKLSELGAMEAADVLAREHMTAALVARASPPQLLSIGVPADSLSLVLDVAATLCQAAQQLTQGERALLRPPRCKRLLSLEAAPAQLHRQSGAADDGVAPSSMASGGFAAGRPRAMEDCAGLNQAAVHARRMGMSLRTENGISGHLHQRIRSLEHVVGNQQQAHPRCEGPVAASTPGTDGCQDDDNDCVIVGSADDAAASSGPCRAASNSINACKAAPPRCTNVSTRKTCLSRSVSLHQCVRPSRPAAADTTAGTSAAHAGIANGGAHALTGHSSKCERPLQVNTAAKKQGPDAPSRAGKGPPQQRAAAVRNLPARPYDRERELSWWRSDDAAWRRHARHADAASSHCCRLVRWRVQPWCAGSPPVADLGQSALWNDRGSSQLWAAASGAWELTVCGRPGQALVERILARKCSAAAGPDIMTSLLDPAAVYQPGENGELWVVL